MDLTQSSLRDLVIAISPCGALEPSPRIASQAILGGGTGVIDLGRGGWQSLQAVARAAAGAEVPPGIRVPAGCAATPDEVRRAVSDRIGVAILTADSPWDVAPTAAWTRVLVEVTSTEEAAAALAAGAHGLIARGMESGGRVSELSTFVLLQRLLADGTADVPVWAAGGIGVRAAVACVIGGAAGVVLDTQLALMPESDLPGDVVRVLRRLDGAETVARDGHRGIRVTGRPLRIAGPRDTDVTILPVGQDGWLAAPLAARWRDTAGAVRGFRQAIGEAAGGRADPHPLSPGGPLAADLGMRVPVAQGPMTRVSDVAGFAAAVAADGGLPFIALALSDGERSKTMLRETAAALGDRPWGAGILGFVPEELRAAQLEAIYAVRPRCAIVAGGRPAQARELEQAGIAAFLHVPSPTLLRQFLEAGSRRFVFEGAECGGHIGPRASFPLWEAQIAVIEEFLEGAPAGTARELQLLFAGGIHDARSAAMVAAMAGDLTRRDVRIGVLMGTAYLFTREAVDNGAIKPLFQRLALGAGGTALLETSPGHVIRALPTAYVDEFAAQRASLRERGADSREIWAELEMLNTGRLRLASKGIEHDGTEIGETAQAAMGMYMAGQVAVLRDAPTTVAELHAAVTAGASDFHRARTGELALAAPAGPDEAPEPLDIAIVGMAGMFPGSTDMDGFWNTILSGKDALREVPAERWDPEVYYLPGLAETKPGRTTMSKWGGFIDAIAIDPIKYGIPPNALGSIDPSQLLALEMANRSLIDAGYPYDAPSADHSRTGVIFAAAPGSDDGAGLAMRVMLPAYLGEVPSELDEQLPTFTEDTFPGHLANVVAGRIANRFDLGGSNYTVDAACAASLAALDAACGQLTAGAADMMLCGAVDLHNSIGDFLMFASVYALSQKGRVATFDREADGTALGEGVACIVLKRLADAQRDGDRVYAVIKGLGSASDGRALSLTAPRVDGQITTMDRAYRQAGLSPREVGLVEAHGTGTVLGDQTELKSLTKVFSEAGAGPASCVLGSVKSQIGHTKAAAGLAGLMKTTLSVYYGVQPPTCNLSSPSQIWDPDSSPFSFLSEPRPWLAPPQERVASLSAFGFGGTNFHAVLRGHQGSQIPRHALNDWPAELFCFRGTARETAHRAMRSFLGTLEETAARPGAAPLRDLAARVTREAETAAGPVQVAIIARDTAELTTLLRRALAGEHDPAAGLVQPPARPPETGQRNPPAVAFLFPGQGSQRPGALGELFVAFPELRQYLEIGRRWAGQLFPPAAFDPAHEREQADRLRDTRVAQPALGICGLAMSHLLGRLGVRPDMSGGHSYGELVALSTAGAFDPETLLALSDARASAIVSAVGEDPGTMAAVRASADQVSAVLAERGIAGEVTLANLNAADQVVISGTTPGVESALSALGKAGLPARRIPVACAFHSPVVAAAAERFAAALAGRPVSAPRLPVWSNRTAAPHADDPEVIRAEMAAQISAPVRFAEQVESMYAAGARVFVEAGPGHVLTNLVRAVLGDKPHLAVSCDGPAGQGLRRFLVSLGEIACAGVPVDLSWLVKGRVAAGPGHSAVNGRPFWTVNGQLIRDRNGSFLPGALIPARPIKESLVPSPNAAVPAGQDSVLAEYLRASRDVVTAQRDVMLAFLGGGQPGGRPGGQYAWPETATVPAEALVVQPVPATVPELTAAPAARPAAVPVTQPAAIPVAQPAVAPAAGPAAGTAPAAAGELPTRKELEESLLVLISDRTGYPVDMIDADLDLEADLSIDSIKRAEIAGELASRFGLQAEEGQEDQGEAMLEELVKARTVNAITEWVGQALAGASAAADDATAPGPDPDVAVSSTVTMPEGVSQDEMAGTSPARFLSRLTRADLTGEPSGSIGTARLLITGQGEVATHLARLLRERGTDVDLTTLDAISQDDLQRAEGLVFLDGLDDGSSALPPAVFPHIKGSLTSNMLVSGQRWLLGAGFRDAPAAAGLAGLFRVVGREYPHCLARYAEFGRDVPAGEIAGLLLAELLDGAREHAVTYADGVRYRRELVGEELEPGGGEPSDAAAAAGLTSDSVVVLVGGARGITANLARELAAASPCRIELVGRTEAPGDEPLPAEIEAAPDAVALRAALARQGMRSPAEIGRAAKRVLAQREVSATMSELRQLGAQVRYHCADASDEGAFRQVLKQVRADHGRIDGLVYGAGIIEDRLIADKDPGSFGRVFGAKVTGARAMLDMLDEMGAATRFVVLFGSISAAFGSRGQVDYAAANDALESLGTAWAGRTGRRCLTVHWGPWAPTGQHPGMVAPELAREYGRRSVGMIDPAQGGMSVLRELAWGDPGIRAVTYYAGAVSDAE